MEIRHLRCFLAVAEELHFARAAERLHIEQSPLSRTIKELEEELGVKLFHRTTRSTRITHAGTLFRAHAQRVLAALQQAQDSAKAAAYGFHRQLRVALSDCSPHPRLSALLARSREEDPDVEIRLFEASPNQQIQGLHHDLYDIGFSLVDDGGDGITAVAVWEDDLMVAVPARHPLLMHRCIPLEDVLRYPLVLGDPQACEGYVRQIDRVLRRVEMEPIVAERVTSFEHMATLVSAGLALGFAGAPELAQCRGRGVVARPLADGATLTTYMLFRDAEASQALARFIGRVKALGASPADRESDTMASNDSEEEFLS